MPGRSSASRARRRARRGRRPGRKRPHDAARLLSAVRSLCSVCRAAAPQRTDRGFAAGGLKAGRRGGADLSRKGAGRERERLAGRGRAGRRSEPKTGRRARTKGGTVAGGCGCPRGEAASCLRASLWEKGHSIRASSSTQRAVAGWCGRRVAGRRARWQRDAASLCRCCSSALPGRFGAE